MRLPLSILSLLAGASVPALAISLSGKVIDQTGAGKAGVVVSFKGDSSTTGTDGTWSLSGDNTSISSRLSGNRQVTAGGHLLVDEGHLQVSLSGYDLMGRPRAGSAVTTMLSGTPSGISARTSTAGVDTMLYSWNGKTFLRDTASASRSGIVAIFDTTVNASIIYGWLTDVRDTQVYRTVKIGTQTWMVQNLNYQVDSSWCYDDLAANCTKYGRLYQWAAAMDLASTSNSSTWGGTLPHQGICPSGWHVPSDAEWSTLVQYIDSATSSTNPIGFNVPPAGSRHSGGAFLYLGDEAFFWSSSEFNTSHACSRYFINRSDVFSNDDKSLGFSVRCLQN